MDRKFKKGDRVQAIEKVGLISLEALLGWIGTVVSCNLRAEYGCEVQFPDKSIQFFRPEELELIPEEVNDARKV